MTNITINSLPTASTIDGSQDILPIYTASSAATQGINRNTLLGLSSAPVGLTDSQTLTNKIITSPTISGPTLSGTITGTYTIGGTPTFPNSVTTLTGTQTLTNKTLTSPTINSPTITNATLSSDTITGYTTSNSGTIYGIGVTTGVFNGSNIIVNSNITTGNLYTSKVYNPYKFSVYRNASLSLAAGSQVVFDTKEYDTGSNYSTSTGYFTAPIAGFYSFKTALNINPASSVIYTCDFYKNGSSTLGKRGFELTTSNTGGIGMVATADYQLAANDTIGVFMNTTYGGNTSFNVGTNLIVTYFSGFLVSAT